jgi:hypothetical protein
MLSTLLKSHVQVVQLEMASHDMYATAERGLKVRPYQVEVVSGGAGKRSCIGSLGLVRQGWNPLDLHDAR